MIKAVIFDMDGTVFDTNKEIYEATRKTFKEYNKNLKYKDTKKYFGRGAVIYLKELAKDYKINEDVKILLNKRKKYSEELSKNKLRIFPGIKQLLKELKKNKIKAVLATGSSLSSVKKNLKRTRLNKSYFNLILTRNNTKHTKPNPEIFLKTIKKLKVKPNEAVVIEDATNGVEAAKRAKIKVIAITNSFSKKELKKADLIINSAKKLNLKKLNSL